MENIKHRDMPIKNIEEDKLKFGDFASKVAKGILNYKDSETLIISLEGKWGSGKTSLMNLVESELKNEVEFLHFNPWLLTDLRQVVKLFFDELVKVVKKILPDSKSDNVLKYTNKLSYMIVPDSVSFMGFSFNIKERFPDKEKSIEELKNTINQDLKKLNKKIVIIVDDIDRLGDDETEFIFRLTKGIADFDNLIYILLYDKDIVSKSLERFKSENGEKYLEKIVQYSISVPKTHDSTIKDLLFMQFDEIIQKLQNEDSNFIWDEKNRWYLVDKIIPKYIKTIRDVNQIVNIISFEYPIVYEDVNFVDFFLITLLRVKNHKLYELIKNEPNSFLINYTVFLSDEMITKAIDVIQERFENEMKDFHDFRDILEIIFPAMGKDNHSSILGKYHFDNHKERFICDPYYHENYFAYTMSDDKMSNKEYIEVKSALFDSDFEKFKIIMLDVDKKDKSSIFFDMFEKLDLEKINGVLNIENSSVNLMKISENLVSKNIIFVHVNYRAKNVAYEIAIKHTKIDKFIENRVLEDKTIKLHNKIYLFGKIKKDNIEIEESTKIKIKEKTKIELENLCISDFIEQKEPPYLISYFKEYEASLDKLSKEMQEYIFKSKENFFVILDIFKVETGSTSSYRGEVKKYGISKDLLSRLINLEEIESYVKNIDITKIDERDSKLLKYWDS